MPGEVSVGLRSLWKEGTDLLRPTKEQACPNRGVLWALPVLGWSWDLNLVFLLLSPKLFKPCTPPPPPCNLSLSSESVSSEDLAGCSWQTPQSSQGTWALLGDLLWWPCPLLLEQSLLTLQQSPVEAKPAARGWGKSSCC